MHPYPRLFRRANVRLQRGLSPEARLDLMIQAQVILWLAETGHADAWEDLLYLANYGLITACPN